MAWVWASPLFFLRELFSTRISGVWSRQGFRCLYKYRKRAALHASLWSTVTPNRSVVDLTWSDRKVSHASEREGLHLTPSIDWIDSCQNSNYIIVYSH